MRTYWVMTRMIPVWIVRVTSWLLGVKRLTFLVILWIGGLITWANAGFGDLYLNLSAALALAIGFAWLSIELPWDDIDRLVAYARRPRAERAALRRFDKRWQDYMVAAGLARRSVSGDGSTVVPPLYGLEFNELGQLAARPGLLLGQTVADWESAGEVLRAAVDADRLRVVPNAARTGVELVFSFGDALLAPLRPALPANEGEVPVDIARMGVTEDGRDWLLNLRISTLFGGATGSGKGSMLWSLVWAQLPNIASGRVQVQGVDLKGGMELSMGRALFTRLATEPAEAVVLLEEAAKECQTRAKRMAGSVRSHTATVEEPMVMIVVDELAALVAYSTDRDLMRRAEAALAILLTQGRAVGYYVHGFLQDPRKEVLKLRHLFTQAVALRLNGSEEAAMMLSHEAVRAGARCQDISRKTPGVAYVIDETGIVTRVRATYVSDEQIREAAELFPALVQIPIIVPGIEPPARTRRTRQERSEAA